MSALGESSKKSSPEISGSGARKSGLSCAECRRSKLKCDRMFPCQSCIRRGCAAICPEGTLAATKGNKVLMAHAERLTEQVKSMTDRIKELEQALDESQKGSGTSGPHPLLQQSSSAETTQLPDLQTIFDNEMHEVTDAIGSLSIGLDGQAKYHGESAGSEYLQELLPPTDVPRRVATDPKYLGLPFEIVDLCNAYPFGQRESVCTKHAFLPFIPTRERALHLADLYYCNVAWMYDPIVRNDFLTTIIDPLYGHTGIANVDRIHSHRLSVFFILLASGVFYDNIPSASIIAEQYQALSRAALSLDSILDEATCATVQAIFMTIRYIYQSDRTNNEGRWLLMGVCARVAQIIGLQRDSAGWNLGEDEIQRRRVLFWEIYTFDAWTSVVNGRPPALSISHTDCRFPVDLDALVKPSGSVETGWHVWKFRYSASCLSISVQHVFSTRIPCYSALLELDRKIRKFAVPPHLQCPIEASEVGRAWSSECPRAMQQYCALCERESNLLYIHRSYFAQAIREAPNNPLQHKYAPSVLATYRSACRLISSLKGLYGVHPVATSQQWFFWSGVFSSCIVLGALIVETPRCPLAQNAMQELDQAMLLYERGSEPCRPPATLPVLQKLRSRAVSALTGRQMGATYCDASGSPSAPDELEVLKGSRTVITKTSPSSSPSSSGSAHAYQTLSKTSEDFMKQFGPAHPSLMNYYSMLGNPGLVLPATKEFDMDSSAPSTYFASSSGMQDDWSAPSPFFDASLQAAAASYAQQTQGMYQMQSVVPNATEQQPYTAPPLQQHHQPHQQFQQQSYDSGSGTATLQPQNHEEIWREFIYHLGVTKGP
ncbi:hypothetical protein HYDPIDRAFT_110852 [Hydnomerulius pinastri MD-312]|nr:hypothetical protein HYDPIDRAFT_110852 [Hydnomerulius pinastri MD-312]